MAAEPATEPLTRGYAIIDTFHDVNRIYVDAYCFCSSLHNDEAPQPDC
jgi:hypothetical protein